MRTVVLEAASGYAEQALQVLRSGGLVAFPTDTVYGVGALAFAADAVARLYWAKERPAERAIPILLGRASDVGTVAEDVSDMATTLARRFWPGPLTLVVRKAPDVPNSVASGPTVGVRVPDHAIALAILQAAGPMAVTSANVSGQVPARTAREVTAQLDAKVDLVVDGGMTPGGGDAPRILRPGPISMNDIQAALR